MGNVYLDTSYFIGLLENQSGRMEEATKILKYEKLEKSTLVTSQLTVQEFLVRTYDKYKKDSDCEERVAEVVALLQSICTIHALSESILLRSAYFTSVWGELRKLPPKQPRDRGFRWDAIHLATADHLKCLRAYAWDGPWKDFPREHIPNIGDVRSPATCPQLVLPAEAEPLTN